ncbi:hypothetical protein LEP1GSC103_3754 [Leptospira borgpetersenii serovar Javanica str. UI 09931]|uniref:Uncharacterized protein n=5 Tax=Leptospira borgpetersenii TaxID=174 RepID=M3HTW5_LEPBO|nr:hypothetical protein LBBP_00861 [Leptospira borgpetersenii serovar Ballum]EKP15278.1 hypothetical protein LEP1GSC128_1986 [Leptospira borgpetersenii str. 200801926]EKQ93038.1 hypothetical protein LEP1GSC101_3890 [Leptospira borgpetersenii str. UI 09149]EKQ98389.1 hypothetical protein LEP1GSC121_3413 [Leptospira borgpetersenii serovar Castellonis str. 200801910]EMG01010.1 hypothetical protein LEP1GSC123_3632 [Leptospira borgpetersenii str. 200701203]EMK09431.1 hypothetical protein LEP1GSC066
MDIYISALQKGEPRHRFPKTISFRKKEAFLIAMDSVNLLWFCLERLIRSNYFDERKN